MTSRQDLKSKVDSLPCLFSCHFISPFSELWGYNIWTGESRLVDKVGVGRMALTNFCR